MYYSDGDFGCERCRDSPRPASGYEDDQVRLGMKLVVFLISPAGNATLLIRRATVRWTSATTFGIALTQVSAESHAELTRLAAIHLPALWSSLN